MDLLDKKIKKWKKTCSKNILYLYYSVIILYYSVLYAFGISTFPKFQNHFWKFFKGEKMWMKSQSIHCCKRKKSVEEVKFPPFSGNVPSSTLLQQKRVYSRYQYFRNLPTISSISPQLSRKFPEGLRHQSSPLQFKGGGCATPPLKLVALPFFCIT